MITIICINLTWAAAKMNGNGKNIEDEYNPQVQTGQLLRAASRLFLVS
jgi:hypothetical protein